MPPPLEMHIQSLKVTRPCIAHMQAVETDALRFAADILPGLQGHYRGRNAAVLLANQIMGRRIVASQYLAFRKPDGDWHPETSFQRGKEERGMKAVKAPTPPGQSRRRKN
jgi:hypothetical protein